MVLDEIVLQLICYSLGAIFDQVKRELDVRFTSFHLDLDSEEQDILTICLCLSR